MAGTAGIRAGPRRAEDRHRRHNHDHPIYTDTASNPLASPPKALVVTSDDPWRPDDPHAPLRLLAKS